MVPSEKQYEQIIGRIFIQAPGAVILTDPNDTAEAFVDEMLAKYGDVFKQESKLPVRVNGADYSDSFSIWREIAKNIKEALDTVYPETILTKTLWQKMEKAPSTMEIKSLLQRILVHVAKNSTWRVILFLENFEEIVMKMPYPDVFKLREIDNDVALLTVSHEHPIQLGQKYFQNDYYCNQFDFITI